MSQPYSPPPSGGWAGPPGYPPHLGPTPAYAPPWGPGPGLEFAGFGRRLGGYIIDGVILLIPFAVVIAVTLWPSLSAYLRAVQAAQHAGAPPPAYAVPARYYIVAGITGAVIGVLYWGLLVSLWGRTVGQAAVGTRVVRQEDPTKRLPPERAILRAVVWWGVSLVEMVPAAGFYAALLTFLALLWVAWDPRKQGLHDKLGGALVVRPAPVLPYPIYGPGPYGQPPAPAPPHP